MADLSGMTGFGRAEGAAANLRWIWEVRSVNGKGLEARYRLPGGFERIEAKARERVKQRFTRGNLQASLNLRQDAGNADLRIDTARLEALIEASRPYVARNEVAVPQFDGLLAVRGVLDVEDVLDEKTQAGIDAAILESFSQALDALKSARLEEGAALKTVLSGHVDQIETLTSQAKASDSVRLSAIRDRIAAKFAELLPEGLDEDRLTSEAATMAVKMDIREEIDRLEAHIVSARDLLSAGSPVGRKLDFLSQEFNREANTLCSKSADSSLTRIGLELKNTIDQLREQVQNVE